MFGRLTRKQRNDEARILAGIRAARNSRPSDILSDKCAAPYKSNCHKVGVHVWPCTYSPAPGWPTKFGAENTVMGGFDEDEAIPAHVLAAVREDLADEYSDPADSATLANYRAVVEHHYA